MIIHPALQILAVTGVGLSCALTVVSWFTLSGERDFRSSYWHAGLMALVAAILATVVFGRATAASSTALCASTAFFLASFHGELTGRRISLRRLAPPLALYFFLDTLCELAGMRLTAGVLLINSTMALFYGLLLVLILRLWRQCHGNGLLVIALGVAIPGSVYLGRAILMLDGSVSPLLFSYSPVTNAALASILVGFVLKMIGYLIFSLEKNHRQHLDDAREIAAAQERSRLAQQHAAAMQDLVSQRDHMILTSSRFSAANSLAVFNSAIVHEISQPLQAMRTRIDVMAARDANAGSACCADDLGAVRGLIDKLANTLANLRRLLGNQQPEREDVDLGGLLADVLPVVRSEMERRGIRLVLGEGALAPGRVVLCNRVLFERLLLNLFSNAIEALEAGPSATDRWIGLRVADRADAGALGVMIAVEDNGPGFPAPLLEKPDSLFHTTKAQGMGLGLSLVRIIAESWRGSLRLYNREGVDGTGACAELALPLVRRETAAGLAPSPTPVPAPVPAPVPTPVPT